MKITNKSEPKRLKAFDEKPAFTAELIEKIFNTEVNNQDRIEFKCPPNGKPAFKIDKSEKEFI